VKSHAIKLIGRAEDHAEKSDHLWTEDVMKHHQIIFKKGMSAHSPEKFSRGRQGLMENIRTSRMQKFFVALRYEP